MEKVILMKNRFMAVILVVLLVAILVTVAGCVNGGAISSKSFGFNKGVTGKAAEPVTPMKDGDKSVASSGDTVDRKDD